MADKLFTVWRWADDDKSLYWATLDGTNWTDKLQVGSEGSSNSPALAVYCGDLYLVWNGGAGDSNFYWTTCNQKLQIWEARQVIDALIVSADRSPALAIFQDRLNVGYKGVGGDKSIYGAYFDGTGWEATDSTVTHVGTSNSPAIAAYASTPIAGSRSAMMSLMSAAVGLLFIGAAAPTNLTGGLSSLAASGRLAADVVGAVGRVLLLDGAYGLVRRRTRPRTALA